ncbi:MAG: hypothetical protein ACI8QS_002816 [Planctomycetota bacterium]|jgi:hypothetical protein
MATPNKDDSKPQDALPSLPEGSFRDILQSADRDRIPGAWPTLSYRVDDDEEFLTPLRERMVGRVTLERRGTDHGLLAVFDPGSTLAPLPRGRRMRALERERWVAAQPLFLPGALGRDLDRERDLDERRLEDLRRRLLQPGELRTWARSACRKTKRFRAGASELEPQDPDRDLAIVGVSANFAGAQREDLWVKSARISLHEPDKGLRVRVSFGQEGDDDASRDEAGHRLVGELSQALLPGARLLARAVEPRETLERVLDHKVLFTQAIGYWNAPEGGARMHHDAFGDPLIDPLIGGTEDASGQLGVAYTQLTGKTLWLALSIAHLAERVTEFIGWLVEGDAPWIVEESLGGTEGLAALLEIVRKPAGLKAELAQPGCGRFGPLVERGSEFTGSLIDAGHACLMSPGDVILLPNHGPARTAMHAVFCASPQAGYGLSLAIRRGS